MESEIEIKVQTTGPESIRASLWITFAICVFSDILGGTVSTLMSVYLPTVVSSLLGPEGAGELGNVSAYISALYLIGWTVGGLTWGMIGDRIGRAKALTLAILVYGLFTIATGFSTSWMMVVACRLLTGFGVGGVLVVSTTLIAEIWPEKSRAIAIGILSIGFPVGVFSAGLVNLLVSDWRQGFLVGIIPVALGLISIWGVAESEKWKTDKSGVKTDDSSQVSHANRKNLIRGSLIFGSMLIGLWAIFSWLPTWVQSLLIDSDGQKERGLTMMLLGAGGLSGGFFSGWISNALGVRRAMMICFAGCFVMSVLLFQFNTTFSPIIYGEVALLALFFGISQGLLSVYVPLLFPTSIRATATGFCFNIGRIFTAAAVFFIGALVITLNGYGNAILTFSLVFLIGLITLWLSGDDRSRDRKSNSNN